MKIKLFFLMLLFSFLGFGQTTLPVSTTTMSKDFLPTGFSHFGLGNDYLGPTLKFDTQGDELVLFFTGTPGTLTFDVGVNNTFPGAIPNTATFTVEESVAGSSWSTLGTYNNVAGGTKTLNPASTTRYIRWIYTTKPSGTNIALKNIGLTAVSGFTVTFNNNGGSGTMTNQTASSATALTTNTFTRAGYTFTGWNTASGGGGTAYANSASYPFTANETLYAQWTINQYDVIYDGNTNTGGTVPATLTADYNSVTTLATNSGSLIKTGFAFNGWNTQADGLGTHYNAGASFTIPASNTTLYAEWLTTSPFITTTGSLTSVSTTYGTASATTSFTVSAGNLTNDLIITPPTGFEVSTSTGSGFTTSLNLGSGTQTNTPIYVRLAATTAVGTYNGNIDLASGATTTTKATVNSTVNAKALTISGLSAANKVYDGNTSVVISGTPTYVGLQNGESFSVTGSVTWAFNDKNVGTGKSITQTGTYSAPSANYTVTQPALTANITPKALTVSGATAQNKSYNGNNTAIITGATLVGVISSDAITVSGGGTFASANVGTGIAVTPSLTLGGAGAGNYTITQPTGLSANITAVAPTFTTSSISLNIAGTYGLPGANVSSNSAGAFTYSITGGGNATLLGSTITGVAAGTETLTVNQAANGNYTAVSTTVTVNVTSFTFAAGDMRPLYTTDLSSNGTWEYYNGSTWLTSAGGGWDGKAPQNTSNTINRVLINAYVSGGGSAAKAYNCDFIIQDGGELDLVANDSPPVAAEMIASGKKIEVLSGGALTIQGDIDVASSSSLIVRNGGTMTINQNSIDNVHPMWDGAELFEGGSSVVIKDWKFSASPGQRSLFNASTSITSNANGYKFGNLLIDVNSGIVDWTLIGGGIGIINLCENDFDVSNASTTSYISGASNKSGTNGFMVNGNMTIYDGSFAFGTSFSNDLFNHQFTINGNFECGSDDVLKIHHIGGGSLTENLTGSVTFKGDVKIASSVTSFTNDGGTTVGKTRMSVNYEGGTLSTPKLLDIAPIAVAIPMNIKNGSVRKLATQDLDTNSDSGFTAPFTVETGGTLHFGWAANGTTPLVIKKNTSGGTNTFVSQSGSTLISTSLDGLQKSSGTTGNVQYSSSNKTYNQTATFWYVGKDNQNTGDVFTSGGTAKTIICDLIDNTKTLTLGSSTAIATPGILDIKKGKVLETATEYITGSTGGLTMEDGTLYSIAAKSTSSADLMPRMEGLSNTYSLAANSTIVLAGNDGAAAFDQYLRGVRDYKNLTFSNAGTKTVSSPPTSVKGTILVSDAAILDVDNKTMGGAGTNLTMTGTSEYRTAGTGVKPDAQGAYGLGTGTKVTFTSNAGSLQSLRLSPNYYNIDIVGNNVGTNTATGSLNMQSGSTFTVKPTAVFKLSNTAGFSDVVNGAISPTNSPTITLEALSTVEYAGANQTITPVTTFYKNLTVSGTGKKILGDATSIRADENLNLNASTLEVKDGEAITVKQAVFMNGGIFDIKNNGQLIQIDETGPTSINTGIGTNFQVKRTATVRNLDYVYWSSPIDGFDISGLPDNNRYYWDPIATNANSTQGNWIGASGTMFKGKGYIVRIAGGATSVPITVSLQGSKPFNGEFTYPIARGSTTGTDDCWNLVGNPYPSAIDAEQFLVANTAIEGSVRIWTHGSAPVTGNPNPFYQNFAYNYNPNEYIVYNATGSSRPAGAFNGKIASGQGFFIRMLELGEADGNPATAPTNTTTIGTANITFKNAFRRTSGGGVLDNTNFYRNSNTVTTTIEKSRIWLDLIAPNNEISNTLVGYVPGATLAKDRMYDALIEVETFGFYSLINTQKQNIQGRPVPFDSNDQVPMGIFIDNAGNYTIAISAADGVFADVSQNIYLEDTFLGIIHDLKINPYSFTATPGIHNSRFVLRYTNETLSNPDFSADANSVYIFSNEGLTVTSKTENIKEIEVYDVLGRKLYHNKNVEAQSHLINSIQKTNSGLILNITLENGNKVSKKTIY